MKTSSLFILTFFMLCCSFSSFAQDSEAEAIKASFWNNNAAAYQNATAPEKWKDESAVILYQKIGYEYSKVRVRSKLNAISYYHSRVVLQDKAAVKEFSEFSFSGTFSGSVGYQRLKSKSNVGFKIIKADGTSKEVDLNTAVEIESSGSSGQTKKIAIPDLQVGDILDYYYQLDERFTISVIHAFDPVIATLSQSYPVLHQEIEFNVGDNFYIYFQSLNDAPELENKSSGKERIYSLTIKDIEKDKNTNWYYPYRSAPTIKFQVIYSKTPHFIGPYLPQNDEEPKNALSAREVVALNLNSSSMRYYKILKQHLKRKNLLKVKSEETIQEAYRYLYHQMIGRKLEALYLGKGNLNRNVGKELLKELTYFCIKHDFDYSWLSTVSREYSDLENILLFGETATLLQIIVGNDNKKIYFSAPGLHPHYNEIPSDYEGAKAYTSSTQVVTLPVSTLRDNHSNTVTTVDFNADDMTLLDFKSEFSHEGRNRYWFQGQLLYPYDFIKKELAYFGGETYDTNYKNKKDAAKRQQETKQLKEELAKEREETLKHIIEDDYKVEILDIKDFEIGKTGRFFQDTMSYSYRFQVKGLVSKAGPNYVFQAGNVIGSQVKIAEEDMTRTADIYMPYARSFNNEVVINIPDNYSVQGLENLNKRVVNETGGFKSEAVLKGNQLHISTAKWYTNHFEPAENWAKMLEFLEAAYQFTQEKVLLKGE